MSAFEEKQAKDPSPKWQSLASFLMQHILGQPTKTSINASVTLHGITRSKELVETYHKLGLGTTYYNVLCLRDTWALNELNQIEVDSNLSDWNPTDKKRKKRRQEGRKGRQR